MKEKGKALIKDGLVGMRVIKGKVKDFALLRKTLILIFVLGILSQLMPRSQALTVVSHTMCKGIDPVTGEYTDDTSAFLTTDERAYSWIYIKDVAVVTTITWFWVDPTGTTYKEGKVDLSPGSWYCWSSIEIKDTSAATKTGNWQVEVYYGSNYLFTEEFVLSPPTYIIRFDTSPRIASILVDGANYSSGILPQLFNWEDGTSHTISIKETVSGSPGIRYIFIEWNDGNKNKSRTITVTGPANYTATYKTQYWLNVLSEYSTPQGYGWYDKDTTTTFSVKENSVPDSGILGILGVKRVFERWSGDSTATTPSTNIKMDSPKTVTAVWRTDYTNFFIFLIAAGVIFAVVVVVGVVATKRRKAPPPPMPVAAPPPPPIPPRAPACPTCGQPLTYITQYQRWYCQNCRKYV